LLLAAIGSDDPRTAVAAGAAFSKITGAEIDSQNTAALPPENGEPSDEFAAEFADEAVLPSADLARAHWREVKAQMSQGTRYCRGWDLSRQPAEEILAQLDMEARFEARLRGRFAGAWRGNPLDLEVFPQPAGA
jgi:glycine/D-amino acid oxidase-like deaminating enzyme